MKYSNSLQELEGENLPETDINSYVTSECQRLYQLPLSKLTIDDLRLLIIQKTGLRYIVPLALEKLAENPLIDAGLYAGDLLASLTDLPKGFWDQYPECNNQLVEIKITVDSLAETLNNDILPKLSKFKFS